MTPKDPRCKLRLPRRAVTSPFFIEIVPRSYELDRFGHVNNAVFVQYLEHARVTWFKERGIRWNDYPRLGYAPVVVNVTVNYRRPVESQEPLRVTVRVAEKGKHRLVFAQEVLAQDGAVHSEASVTVVFVDSGKKVIPLPEPFSSLSLDEAR